MLIKRVTPLLIIVAMIFTFAGCGTTSNTSSNDSSSSTVSQSTSAVDTSATEESKLDPLGKYDPGIEISTIRVAYPWLNYPEGDSLENNAWTRAYAGKLGIKVKYLWTAPEDQYQNKLVTSIATGDIPDIMSVDEKSFKTCLDSDLIQDIGGVYEKYASDLLKTSVYGGDSGKANFDYGKVNGKLMGLTGPMAHPAESGNVLYIRMDWLKKLNIPEPKNMNDLFVICKAFATQDPDGNGKNDTFGLGVAKDYLATVWTGGIGDMVGFYNSFHAYPGLWVKDQSSNLVNGIIQPEMKTALGKLQEMYREKIIDPEFAVKDRWKVGDDVTAGKIGVIYGVNWTPINPLVKNFEKDPKAEWKAFPVMSVDDKPAMVQGKAYIPGFYVVSKKCKNPEAVIKMANLGMELLYGQTAKDNPSLYYELGVNKDATVGYYQYRVVSMFPGDKNLKAVFTMQDALDTKSTANLLPEQIGQYNGIIKYQEGDTSSSNWVNYHLYETGNIYGFEYFEKNLYLADEFSSTQTPGMLEKGKSLDDLAVERFTKIIMGADPVDAFDKFVEDWKKLGGDQITQEVNEWYKAN